MAATVEFKLPHEPVVEVFQELVEAGQDMTPVMRQIAGILADASEQAFVDEADPTTGQPWPELNEAYRERRFEQGYTGPLLQVRGQLAASIQSDYGRDYAQVGSNLIYAALQHHGGKPDMPAGPAAVKPRPYLGASPADQSEILDVLRNYLSYIIDR